MANKMAFLLVLLFSSLSFAQSEIKLTKEEFLQRLESGTIIMNKDPLFTIPENDKVKIMDNFKKNYPNFKDAYWFVPNLKTNKYLYTVFYQWPTRSCLYRVEDLDPVTKKVKTESIDPKGQNIDRKYCEKAYGIKID